MVIWLKMVLEILKMLRDLAKKVSMHEVCYLHFFSKKRKEEVVCRYRTRQGSPVDFD
jgi:hypothetical protein